MKIAIINNGSRRIHELTEAFSAHELAVIEYNGQLDARYVDSFDAIVLSGSSKNQAYSNFYQAEVDFLRQTNKPVLAICLGFELICRVYELPIYEMHERIEGPWAISVQEDFAQTFGYNHTVHEKHKWVTQSVSDEFRVMFISSSGVEGLIHKTRPLLGVQFHPEVVQPEDPNPITAPQLLDYLLNYSQNESFMTQVKQAADRLA
jgi:GMP synthase-like glutamine amidotransferase